MISNNCRKIDYPNSCSSRLLTLLLLFVLINVNVWSQMRTVSGIVRDATDGSALIGATVMETGTSNTAVTDVNGRFTLSLTKSNNGTLSASYIGYESAKIPIQG